METLSSIYTEADVFVFASLREGFPRVIEEALLYGLPVVASNIASFDDVLQPGVHAMLTKPGDISDFTHSIEKVVSDSDLRAALISAGHDLMKERYRLQVVPQHIALMRS
jgi:GalNAc-alpha-(1->4)-GalNAc-alpha-(1->3)-diNAcBac-PP-undecaprenol alpha-1,4-N-acetyl-D-galactosaminyltransferase